MHNWITMWIYSHINVDNVDNCVKIVLISHFICGWNCGIKFDIFTRSFWKFDKKPPTRKSWGLCKFDKAIIQMSRVVLEVLTNYWQFHHAVVGLRRFVLECPLALHGHLHTLDVQAQSSIVQFAHLIEPSLFPLLQLLV